MFLEAILCELSGGRMIVPQSPSGPTVPIPGEVASRRRRTSACRVIKSHHKRLVDRDGPQMYAQYLYSKPLLMANRYPVFTERSMISQVARRLGRLAGLEPRRTVFLEGGLGSQLLGMMTFLTRSQDDSRWKCDVSYFFPEVKEVTFVGAGVRRPWELDRYGYPLHSPSFICSRRSFFRRDYESGARDEAETLAKISSLNWSSRFALPSEARKKLHQFPLGGSGQFAAIHVRRGDYLAVASRVVSIRESLAIARRAKSLLPDTVVLLSDDPFTKSDREEVLRNLPGLNCIFFEERDPHVSHGVMRLSQVLITSNSTFSWTASVMMEREDAIALAPLKFFGDRQAALNSMFQASGDWMFLRR